VFGLGGLSLPPVEGRAGMVRIFFKFFIGATTVSTVCWRPVRRTPAPNGGEGVLV